LFLFEPDQLQARYPANKQTAQQLNHETGPRSWTLIASVATIK